MTFLIRTVDFTASGREIVRDRELDQSTLTIGRSTENDIHLSDLAVEQHHAKLTLGRDDSITVEAAGSLGFTHDGRTTKAATFNGAGGGELGFGGFRLEFSKEHESPILITISQTSEQAEDTDEVAGFALASALPSKRAMAWTLLGIIILAFLAVPIYTHLNREQIKPDYDGTGDVRMDASWSTGALSPRASRARGQLRRHVT